jgi:hypothetical protein
MGAPASGMDSEVHDMSFCFPWVEPTGFFIRYNGPFYLEKIFFYVFSFAMHRLDDLLKTV